MFIELNEDTIISVLMPVYNPGSYLRGAIDSILNQTFSDFEFLIINDGSTDESLDIIASYSDPRIKVINNQKNLGLSPSLNRAAMMARGKYLARMDADDVTLPDRFQRQVSYLEKHSEVGVLGGSIRIIDERGDMLLQVPPVPYEPIAVQWEMLFRNPMIHPTIMMRRGLYQQVGGYASARILSEDYDLWRRLIKITQLANLREVIHYYRMHPGSVTATRLSEQKRMSNKVTQKVISDALGEQVPLDTVQKLRRQTDLSGQGEACELVHLVYRLYEVFVRHPSLTKYEKRVVRNGASRRISNLARKYLTGIRFLRTMSLAWQVAPWFFTLTVLEALKRRALFTSRYIFEALGG